jgi:hypothetical protein
MIECKDFTEEELIRRLREAAAAWFNDRELMLLEELIRRARLRARESGELVE